MTKQTKSRLVKHTKSYINKVINDNITGYASQSCFFIILSFVPFIIILMNILKLLPVSPDALINLMYGILPGKIMPVVSTIILDIYKDTGFTLISLTTILAIWSAGKGFMTIIRCLNRIYEVKDSKNWLSTRLTSTLYTILFVICIGITLITLVFGWQFVNFIGNSLPKTATVLSSIIHNRLLLYPAAMMFIFLLLYKYIPNRKTKFTRELPGAIIASAGWFIFSFFYSLIVNNSKNFSSMYGSLSNLAFAMIWMYFCTIIVFVGAEINHFIHTYKSEYTSSNIEE